jgi:hypothetical protein
MKLILNLLVISILSASFPALAFDTSAGNYVSQQDVIRLLKDLFYPQDEVVDYKLNGCVTYQDIFDRQDLFELGFINVETGERVVQAPDSSYVLFLDGCISKITKDRVRYFSTLYHKILGEAGYKELTALQEKYKANPASYVSSKGIKLTDHPNSLLAPYGEFFEFVEVRVVSAASRELMIKNILN